MTTQKPLRFVCFNHPAYAIEDSVNDWLQGEGDIDIASIHYSSLTTGRDREETEMVICIFYRKKGE